MYLLCEYNYCLLHLYLFQCDKLFIWILITLYNDINRDSSIISSAIILPENSKLGWLIIVPPTVRSFYSQEVNSSFFFIKSPCSIITHDS